MVFGACAGLVLLAVAALGTTYTYRSVIARFAGVPEYSEDRDDVADDGANGPRPRIWCFLRRLDTPSSKTSSGGHRGASVAPKGLCSALVYQGARVVWRDAEASIDVTQPCKSTFLATDEDALRRLAARRDVDPLLEVYVHVSSDQQPVAGSALAAPLASASARSPTSLSPTSQAASAAPHSSATTKEALRSLLRSPQGTTEVFAMRTARWLVVHHLDGLVVELGSAVSGVTTELITRLAEVPGDAKALNSREGSRDNREF
ncbi:hypothetical protein HPB51_027514 [Rhipicephalus microplus]|uniref:Uncharacterized protein n=1 Tax=Rhipicephalus microplus TaxID=6941 RepID=A0A9J6CZP2_RHIMP|nr:hypothetical protein HPB51_027514 [Rhipicephalus microplus]